MADDTQSKVAAAWRAAGLGHASQRSDTPVRRATNRLPVSDLGLDERSANQLYVKPESWQQPTIAARDAFTDAGWNERGKYTAPSLDSVTKKPSTGRDTKDDPLYARMADEWNSALRVKLTNEEWEKLNPTQQSAVQFNTQLLEAYDADREQNSVGRRNTEALLSQLGLSADRNNELDDALGVGVGPAVRYSELFKGDGSARTNIANEIARSISNEVNTYIASLSASDEEESGYKFASEQARVDYEDALTYLLNPTSLTTTSWADARKQMAALQYDPEDFKAFVLDRVKQLQLTDAESSADDIRLWFG